MPTWLTKLFSTGGKAIVDSVGNILDEVITNKEEKAQKLLEIEKEVNRHIETLGIQANDELELQLKDVADSRANNTQIQNSDKASWLAKNISYCIDIFVAMIWGCMTAYIVGKWLNIIKSEATVDMTGVHGVYAAVCGMFTQVLSYHRGSSKGSEDKQKTIDLMNTK
jgi:hypothetical protein